MAIDDITLASGQGVQNEQTATTRIPPPSPAIVQVPDYLKVVSSELIANFDHQMVKGYLDYASVRDNTNASQLKILIRGAHAKLENRPEPNAAYGEFITDISLLKAAVVKDNKQNFDQNIKYSAQEDITRAVWRNMPVTRTNWSGMMHAAGTVFRKGKEEATYPSSALRNVAISELGSIKMWAVPTNAKGVPNAGMTRLRQEKIVWRANEVLPRLDLKQQAEVVSAMVAASGVVPGALEFADKWMGKNRNAGQHLEFVFKEVVELCMAPATLRKATSFLEKFVPVVNALPAGELKILREKLAQVVTLRSGPNNAATASDISRLKILLDQFK